MEHMVEVVVDVLLAVVLVAVAVETLVMVYRQMKLLKMQADMQMVVEVLERLDTQVVPQQQVSY